ncbi:MAG: nitrilase-related carbon-nitrogen hydrolase [Candidatus Thorarchaeota archaeon]
MTLVQMPCVEGNRERNFRNAQLMLETYKPGKGVQFIQFPELFAIGFRYEDYKKEGSGVPGPTTDFLSSVAEEHGAYTIGTGIEKSGDKFFNTLVLARPNGEVLGIYRKMHPFQEERDVFKGGEKITIFDCSGIKVGVQICYDIRFPEVTRKLALEGAELVLVPAAFPDPRSEHWNTLVRARAIENQLYVAAVNRIGLAFDGKTYFGHSQMVDPWGVVLSRRNSEERLITTEGNTDMIKSVRSQITCYADIAPLGYDRIQRFEK